MRFIDIVLGSRKTLWSATTLPSETLGEIPYASEARLYAEWRFDGLKLTNRRSALWKFKYCQASGLLPRASLTGRCQPSPALRLAFLRRAAEDFSAVHDGHQCFDHNCVHQQ
jgi:hypothetical protein